MPKLTYSLTYGTKTQPWHLLFVVVVVVVVVIIIFETESHPVTQAGVQ